MIFNMTPYRRPITLVPVPTLGSSNYTYTGAAITPTVTGYDSTLMIRAGRINASDAGTYTTTYKLRDPLNCRWEDGTVEDKELTWTINKASYQMALSKVSTTQYRVQVRAPSMLSDTESAQFSLTARVSTAGVTAKVGDISGSTAQGYTATVVLRKTASGNVAGTLTVTLTYTGSNSNINETAGARATVSL